MTADTTKLEPQHKNNILDLKAKLRAKQRKQDVKNHATKTALPTIEITTSHPLNIDHGIIY